MKKSLAEMSGDKPTTPKLPLNQITFNGAKGEFVYTDILGGKKEDKKGKKKYDEKSLGEEISLVFLKIRRRLSAFRKGQKPLQTNEHNTKNDFLTLYGAERILRGTNDALREQFKELRTQQVVYCLYKGELVRLTVKGSALGSEAKAEDTLDFYKYISNFKRMSEDAHFYEYETELYGVEEVGAQTYKTMAFRVGKKLNAEEMQEVEDKMTIAFEHCEASDKYFKQFEKKKPAPHEDMPEDDGNSGDDVDESDDEPKDDINPEDIPF